MSDTTRTAPDGAETLAPQPQEKTPARQRSRKRSDRRNPSGSDDEDVSIRPFRFEASEEDLADLRRRILATRWPDRETVDDDIAGRAARDDAEARRLLGDRI